MSPLLPFPTKIQAVIIMAVYFMYFVTVGLMMPFRNMSKYFIHLAMCVHNGVATAFTQFTDPEGLFNTAVRFVLLVSFDAFVLVFFALDTHFFFSHPGSDEIASKGVENSTVADGILTALGGFGLITLFLYIGLTILFKLLGLRNEPEPHEESENMTEFSKRKKKNLSNVKSALNVTTHARNQSAMMANIMVSLAKSDPVSQKEEWNVMNENPMKKSTATSETTELINPLTKAIAATGSKSKAIHTSVHTKSPAQTSVAATVAGIKKPTIKKSAAKKTALSLKASVKLVQAALPEHWSEHKDPVSGKIYFHHRETHSTSWTRPTLDDVPTKAAVEKLAAGWTAAVDPTSGKTYYGNASTGAVSWTKPTGLPDVS